MVCGSERVRSGSVSICPFGLVANVITAMFIMVPVSTVGMQMLRRHLICVCVV